MNTSEVIRELRTRNAMSQDELAEKLFVTRQAVSRWETGETVPNTETLKLLSGLFCVSINTLLGSPRKLYCQCCGMPLEDAVLGRNEDGSLNQDYCRWCYADGQFMYSDMDDLIEVCVPQLVKEGFTDEQARSYLRGSLPKLDYWKDRAASGDVGEIEALKLRLIEEINALGIEGMPKLDRLNALAGDYVNLTYPLPGGASVRFLDDGATYLGNQLDPGDGSGRCYGVVGCRDFILVCTYGDGGTDPELLLYKKR